MSDLADRASRQADALTDAADLSPFRSERAWLRRRGAEWNRAWKAVNGAELEGYALDDIEILAAGALVPGMVIWWDGAVEFVRYNGQAASPSLLTRDMDTGRESWLNVSSNAAPVVVVG